MKIQASVQISDRIVANSWALLDIWLLMMRAAISQVHMLAIRFAHSLSVERRELHGKKIHYPKHSIWKGHRWRKQICFLYLEWKLIPLLILSKRAQWAFKAVAEIDLTGTCRWIHVWSVRPSAAGLNLDVDGIRLADFHSCGHLSSRS
jgi:hypothetical protein